MATLFTDALDRIGALEPGAVRAANGFASLIPHPDPAVLALLPTRRPGDVQRARAAAADAGARPVLTAHGTTHTFLDDSLVLYSEHSRELYTLNPTASFIWLRCAEGMALPEVARELGDVFPDHRDAIEQDTWTMAADWLGQGLMRTRTASAPPASPRPLPRAEPPRRRWIWNAHERVYRYLGWRVCVHAPGDLADAAVHATLVHFETASDEEYDGAIEIAASRHGYEVRRDGVVVAGTLQAWQLPAVVHRQMIEGACAWLGGLVEVRATLVTRGPASALLLPWAFEERACLTGVLARAGLAVLPRERVLFRRNPVRLVRRTDPERSLQLRAIVLQEMALDGRSRMEPCPRPAALQALLKEDPDQISTLHDGGAAQFAGFIGELDCRLLTVGDPVEAAKLMAAVLEP